MRKGILRKLFYYALHAVGFVLLYLVLRDFDWEGFRKLFGSFGLLQFIAGFGLLVAVYLLKSLRWMLINRTFGVRLSYGTTLIFFLVSGFLSVITPGRVGEFAKIFFLKRKTGVSATVATSSVVLDRVWDVLVLSLLGGVGALMVFGGFRIDVLTIVLITAFFLIALTLILFPVMVFVPLRFLFRRKAHLLTDMDRVYHDWKANALRLFLPGFGTTLAAFFALAFIPLIFTGSIGQQVGIVPAVSAVSISNMLAFLPVTVAGFGTRELVFSEIWKMMAYSTESAITISTAYFICNYLGSIVLGGVTYLVWFRRHFRLREIKQE
jgi:glycosyltransferase 2 family protein